MLGFFLIALRILRILTQNLYMYIFALVIQIFLTLHTLHPFSSTKFCNSYHCADDLFLLSAPVPEGKQRVIHVWILDCAATSSYHKTEPELHRFPNWTEQNICVWPLSSGRRPAQRSAQL